MDNTTEYAGMVLSCRNTYAHHRNYRPIYLKIQYKRPVANGQHHVYVAIRCTKTGKEFKSHGYLNPSVVEAVVEHGEYLEGWTEYKLITMNGVDAVVKNCTDAGAHKRKIINSKKRIERLECQLEQERKHLNWLQQPVIMSWLEREERDLQDGK